MPIYVCMYICMYNLYMYNKENKRKQYILLNINLVNTLCMTHVMWLFVTLVRNTVYEVFVLYKWFLWHTVL